MKEPILCYADDSWAYFTTHEDQGGDGWHKIPYEYNAIRPYDEWIVKIAYSGNFSLPKDGHYPSPYSVDAINEKVIPWLRPYIYETSHSISIFAGTTLSEFIRLVKMAGGKVYREV